MKKRTIERACLPRARFRFPATEILGLEDAKRIYQPIGPYLTEHQSLADYATLASLSALAEVVNSLWTMHDALEARMEVLMGADNVSDVIDCYMEMEAFLQGVTNKETLTGMLAELKGELTGQIKGVENRVNALETAIASRPALPATSVTGGLYAVKDGQYVMLCGADEQLLSTTRATTTA